MRLFIRPLSFHSTSQIWRFIKERGLFLFVSLFLVTGIYIYVVLFYEQSFGFFYHQKPPLVPTLIKEDYTIYTGGTKGIYYQVGDIVKSNNQAGGVKELLFTPLRFEVKETSGGYENVLRVLGDSSGRAFGLIHQEAYQGQTLILDELNFITPLYLERMHILYEKDPADTNKYLISSNTDQKTLTFLRDHIIELGSPSSGTHIISRYLIDELNAQIVKEGLDSVTTINRFHNYGSSTAINDVFVSDYLSLSPKDRLLSYQDSVQMNSLILSSFTKEELENQILASNTDARDTLQSLLQENGMIKEEVFQQNYYQAGISIFEELATDSSAIDSVNKRQADIICFITGAPSAAIDDLLQSGKYGLISIEPDFTANLKNKYGIDLNFTTFKNKYQGFENVTTFGTFAYLITNKRTPPAHIREFLNILDTHKDSLKNFLRIGQGVHKSKNDTTHSVNQSSKGKTTTSSAFETESPLNEFDFRDHYNNKNSGYKELIWRNILLYIITLIPCTILVYYIVRLIISISITDYFHDKLVKIIDENIPKNRLPSYFGFAKLDPTFDFDELTGEEYLKLKQKAIINLVAEYSRDRRTDYYGRKQLLSELRKFDEQKLARLAAILISISQGILPELTKKNPLLEQLIKEFRFSEEFETYFGQDEALKSKILDLAHSNRGSLFSPPQVRVLRLLISLLDSTPITSRIRNTKWYQEDELNNPRKMFVRPFIKSNQIAIVNRIIQGISNLLDMRTKVSENYTHGRLTEKHHNFLFDKIDAIVGKLRKNLTHRIGELIVKQKSSGTIDHELLRHYFTADYLTRRDYEYLIGLLTSGGSNNG
ncbi:MAG: TAXI family TRAP transporter solute-binding subunit [Bacteroidota bacterium]